MFLTLLLAPLWAPLPYAQEPPATATPEQSPLPGFDQLEVRANTFTGNRQQDASVAADADGNLMVAWGSRRQEQGTYGIFAQRLDPRGRPLSTEIHVNQYVPREQAKPAVTFADDGNAWVVWHSTGQDGDGVGLFARRFGATEEGFQGLGDEFRVNQVTPGDQMDVVLTATPDGGVLFAWTGYEGTRQVIRARAFTAEGTPAGDEFRLSDDETRLESLVSLTSTDQGVLAAWARRNSALSPEGIGGTLVTFADGQPQRKPFTVVEGDEALVVEPSIDAAADGSFVVAWMSTQSGTGYTAMAQRFSADLEPLADAFEVEAGGSKVRSGAQVAVAPDGRFLVAYNASSRVEPTEPFQKPTDLTSIRAQRYAADGTPMGESFRLNRYDEGEQTLMVGVNAKHLLWTPQDQVVAAWHGKLPSDSRAVGVTLFVPEAFKPQAPAPIEPMAAALDLSVEDVYGDPAKPIYDPHFVRGPYVPPPPASGGTGGFEAIVNTGWTPPDPDLAVGPDHIVTVANGEISFHTKAGVRTFVDTIAGSSGFWGSVGAGGFVFDPIAVYDSHTDRFIVAAADGAGSNDAICIAMSDDDDPNGTWHKYRFVVSSTCGFLDFPNLGVNEDAIFISGDCFAGGGNRIFMWDKSKVMSGQSVTMKQLQSSGSLISLGGTKNHDTNSPGYFATTYSSSSSRVMLKAVTDPNGSPNLHQYEVSVPGFSFPPDADQLGTSNRADTIDWRVKNGVVRNGSLWCAHNTGGNSAKVRWYEFDLNGWPTSGSNPSLAQSGTLDFGNGEHNWFPDIAVADNGDAAIAFNRSSTSQYIGIEYVTRKAGDPAGTMSAPKPLQDSTSPETGSRWGDYAGVEQDPLDPTTFWSHHEYRTSGWRTWVGEFSMGPELDLSVTPIIAGQTSTWTATGGVPGEDVYFLVSTNAGTWAPPQLGGLVLDLGAPASRVGPQVVNAGGFATVFVSVPTTVPVGANAYVQAAIIRGAGGVDSIKSNLATEVIQ